MTAKARKQADKTDPWLRQVQQQAEALRHGVIRLGAQIVQIKQTEQRLLVPAVFPSSQEASGESFVTDWADS